MYIFGVDASSMHYTQKTTNEPMVNHTRNKQMDDTIDNGVE